MEFEGHKLRHELKYEIPDAVYHTLRERFGEVLRPDENMASPQGYLISSLYFDDIHNTALEEKISGTRFRKKFRIRVYERSDAVIKLESKIKFDSFISKESARLSREEYDRLLNGDYDFLLSRPETVCRELAAYRRIRLIKPVTVVEYRREAYVAREGNVRITFDKNISASVFGIDLFDPDLVLTEVMPAGRMALEVKYDDYLPSHIHKLIQTERANRQAISKYVMCRNRNLRVRHQ